MNCRDKKRGMRGVCFVIEVTLGCCINLCLSSFIGLKDNSRGKKMSRLRKKCRLEVINIKSSLELFPENLQNCNVFKNPILYLERFFMRMKNLRVVNDVAERRVAFAHVILKNLTKNEDQI